MNKKGLGRGLQALLPTVEKETDKGDKVLSIPVKDIKVNRNQPRHDFDEEKLRELALSILEHGVVQPIIVRQAGAGKYELVAGERRWRACKINNMKEIPAIVKKLSEKQTTEVALIENIQRQDLNPIEEAAAYKALIEEHGLTQEALAKRLGKSRPFITNIMRLLGLPEQVRGMIASGTISAGHARALISLPRLKEQEEMARTIASKGLSVRQTEKTVKDMLQPKSKAKPRTVKADPTIKDLEEKLTQKLATKVKIHRGDKAGRIEIEYYGDEDLERLIESLLGEIE